MINPFLPILLIILLALLALLITSCSLPLKASVSTDYGSVGYSSKSGLLIEVDQRSRK